MPQIRLTLDPKRGEGNLARAADSSLLVDDGLATAVTICLFTDAPADADDGIELAEDRRGYWDDIFDDDDPTFIGSKLWIWQREPLNAESLKGAETAAKDALKRLVTAGIASRAEATLTRLLDQEDTARLSVVVYGIDDANSPYQETWELHFALA